MGIVLLWAIVKVATDVVATFDGATRTVTICRAAPWRTQIETVGFDAVHVEAQRRTRLFWYGGLNAFQSNYFGIAVILPGERTLWLSDVPEAECYDMCRQVLTLIRRPTARPAQ
jgi:hypothetical protein